MQQENSNDKSLDKDIAALSDMAVQHYQKGHLQQAQDVCQRILRKQQRPDAILILANIAHEQRNFDVAAERYQQFLSLIPNNAAVRSHLGDAYTELERWTEAIEAYEQVLAFQANDVVTIIKMGRACHAARRWLMSISLYEQALALQPDNADVHRYLGATLQKMGRSEKAIKSFEQALSLRPDYVAVRIELALVLRHLGRAEEALVQLEQGLAVKPDDVDALIMLALTLRQLGQTQLAVERLEQVLGIRPTCGGAYYHISVIQPKQELIPVVEKLVSDPALPKSDAIYCHFALGNLFNGEKSFDQAFNHFLRANSLHRETFTYDDEEISRNFDTMIKIYSNGFFQGKRQFGSASTLPVFIVGMPRSGTTLTEQILSSHALVHGAGELDALPGISLSVAKQLKDANPDPEHLAPFFEKIAEEYSAQYLQELTGNCPDAERVIDKQPGNFANIGLIKALFPNARIIHCQRNPLDNCVSLFFHFFKAFTCSFELTELGRYYSQYQHIMSHWQNLFPGEIFTVRYEELVVDQERVSKQLIDYLGLEWDEKCIDFHNNERNVMTPSNIQVRQPMYKNSMNRWKLYEKHLQPLINVLQQAH